jgi:hypothetical protein
VQDRSDLTPFTIALVRGHFGLAKSILDIAEAQYLPRSETTKRKRYEIVIDANSDADSDPGSGSDSASDSSSDEESHASPSNHDHGIGVRFDLVDEQHTIDDIRDLASTVKSTISPTFLLHKKANFSSFLNEAETKFEEAFKDGISQSKYIFNPYTPRNYGTTKTDRGSWRVSSRYIKYSSLNF